MRTQPGGKHLATAHKSASRTEAVGDTEVWNRQLHQLEPELRVCCPAGSAGGRAPRLPHEGGNATASGNPSAPPAGMREHAAAKRERDALRVGRLCYGLFFDTQKGHLYW